MKLRRNLLALAAVILVAGGSVVSAAPASATTQPMVVSIDGVSWGDHLTSSLFAGALILPGQEATRTFWVKNQTTSAGNLAVALSEVTGADPDLLAALKIRASSATPGPVRRFRDADPCVSLLSGVELAAGATALVSVSITLANSLAGRTSQGSVGSFSIPVSLTSTDVAAPDGCGPTTPEDPPHGGGGGDPHVTPPGTIGTVVISGAADGTVPPAESDDGPLSGLGGKGHVRSWEIEPNTGRFWQEIDISGYLVALVLGGIFAWWRRRRDNPEETYA
jgi:hypothetical protein